MFKEIRKLNKDAIRLNTMAFKESKGKRQSINKMLSKSKYRPVKGYVDLEMY